MSTSTDNEIPWSPMFETGHPELDAQHIGLLAVSKRLKDLVAGGGSWEEVRSSVAAFVLDCCNHFRFEEKILLASNFPRCEEHAAQHRRIEDKLNELSALVTEVDGSDPQHSAMVKSLELLLVDVIVRHDLDYKSHLLDAAGY